MSKSERKKYRPTTRAMVESKLRRYIWMQSRERAECKRRFKNTCQSCGAKGSRARGREVKDPDIHHINPVDFGPIIDLILDKENGLLCSPDNLIPLCKECHKKTHSGA